MKRQDFPPLKGPKHHIRVPPFSPVGYHLARGIHIGENPARKFIPALNLPGWRCPTKRHKTGLKLRTQKGITFTQHGSWGGAGVLVFREREISPVLVIHLSFTKMDFAALPIPILSNRSKILSQMTSNCTSGRSIFLCQAISKCSLVETAFLLLVTVSTVQSGHSNIFPDIIWWSSDPFSCRVCLRCTINCCIITDGTKISTETETFFIGN